MRKPQAWTKLTVVTLGSRWGFRHGNKVYYWFSSELLDDGANIRLMRGDEFDTGDARNIGGHDGRTLIFGLDKIVPVSERIYRNLPMTSGAVAKLVPEWFNLGDEIRISMHASRFRAALDVLF